jgi:ABC-type protease/lipase transport system fused ATPase/permease subunit
MGLTTQNPAVISAGEILSAVFNLPADRAIRKWNNLVKAADSETELWQSIALAMGYSEWDVKLMDNQKEPTMNTGLKKKKFGKLND